MGNLVPKVHPLARAVEPDDPMELVAAPAEGDPDFMLQCIVEEFAWMGMDTEELLDLFRSPAYPVLNQLLRHYGEEAIHERVRALLMPLGGIRFHEVIDDESGLDEEEPALIQLSVGRITGGPLTPTPLPLQQGERGKGEGADRSVARS